ncbi:DUF2285 domain-containing protein [Variovorax sp. LARHSF232]
MTHADELLHVRAAHARRLAAPSTTCSRFDLWRVPGRKRLAPDDAGLILLAAMPALRLRALLAEGLAHGAAYACAVPLGPGLRARLDDFHAQARALDARPPAEGQTRAASRSALLHLRALQALDGAQAGASQRDIAQTLFGADAVALRWHADGELRAQVRHLLARAAGLMHGGYLALAGIQGAMVAVQGDEVSS